MNKKERNDDENVAAVAPSGQIQKIYNNGSWHIKIAQQLFAQPSALWIIASRTSAPLVFDWLFYQ